MSEIEERAQERFENMASFLKGYGLNIGTWRDPAPQHVMTDNPKSGEWVREQYRLLIREQLQR